MKSSGNKGMAGLADLSGFLGYFFITAVYYNRALASSKYIVLPVTLSSSQV
jgi:hypothetical protein